jgi:uncharacterized protein
LKTFPPIIPQIQVTLDCNFQCNYCFQRHNSGIIDLSTVETILEKTVAHHLNGCHNTPVLVIWHGGEPLLAGVDFFEAVIKLESRFSSVRFQNRVQTNGSLMTEAFSRFFAAHNFHVGFSLDGPEELNNIHRRFEGSARGTFHAVMKGINNYRKYADAERIPIIAVITRESIGREKEIFTFFKDLRAKVQLDICDLRYLDFAAIGNRQIVPENCRQLPEFVPSADAIGGFLIRLFDLWFHDSTGQVDFNELRNDVRMILQPEVNRGDPFHKKRCDPGRIIFDPVGRAFSCDQYINDDATCLGRIQTHSIEDILNRKIRLWEAIKTRLRRSGDAMACGACEWGRRHMGGCLTCMKYNALLLDARAKGMPDDQWDKADLPASLQSISGETYYCQGLRVFRNHVRQVIEQELANG